MRLCGSGGEDMPHGVRAQLLVDPRAAQSVLDPVVGLEQSRSLTDAARVIEALPAWCQDPELQRVFADWIRQIVERLVASGTELPAVRTLQDVRMTLERVAQGSGSRKATRRA